MPKQPDQTRPERERRSPHADRPNPQHERAMDDPGRGQGDVMDDLLPGADRAKEPKR
jgi:hypothetical protein